MEVPTGFGSVEAMQALARAACYDGGDGRQRRKIWRGEAESGVRGPGEGVLLNEREMNISEC